MISTRYRKVGNADGRSFSIVTGRRWRLPLNLKSPAAQDLLVLDELFLYASRAGNVFLALPPITCVHSKSRWGTAMNVK